MKLETIERITEKYRRRLEEITKEENKERSNHFRHISAQPITAMVGLKELISYGLTTWEEVRSEYLSALTTLRNYLILLKKDPDFKKKELNEEKGAFPRVRDNGDKGPQNYVEHSIELLK